MITDICTTILCITGFGCIVYIVRQMVKSLNNNQALNYNRYVFVFRVQFYGEYNELIIKDNTVKINHISYSQALKKAIHLLSQEVAYLQQDKDLVMSEIIIIDEWIESVK